LLIKIKIRINKKNSIRIKKTALRQQMWPGSRQLTQAARQVMALVPRLRRQTML